ncbi:MAG: hypothetical protein AABW86_02990 [Candidatus Micrarchaeota archaeon]
MRFLSIFQRRTIQPNWYRWKDESSPSEYILNPRRSVSAKDFEPIHSDYFTHLDDSSAVADCLHRMHGYLLNTTDVPTALTAIGLLEKHGRFGRIADVAERGRDDIRPFGVHFLLKHERWELAAESIMNSHPNCFTDSFVRLFERHLKTFVSTRAVSSIKLIAKMSKEPLLRETASLEIESIEKRAREQASVEAH